MNGYNLTTAVWGENFVNNYINFIIPSLLAEGNIPYLKKKTKVFYQIFTSKYFVSLIKNSESFKELESYCDVHLDTDLIDELDKMGFKDKREVVNICFSKGITIANKYSNPWVRIQPDVLQAKNNFVTLCSLIEKKYKVIFYPMGLKVYEKILNDLNKNYKINNVLSIESFDLVYLSMKYAAKEEENKIFNNYRPKYFQQSIKWSLGEKGYLERAINAGELICVYPSRKDIEYKFKSLSIEVSDYLDTAVPNSEDWKFIKNSNDFVTCGIEENVEDGDGKFLQNQRNFFLKKPSKLALALANNNMSHSKILKKSFLEYPIRYFSSKYQASNKKEWITLEKKTRLYAVQVILLTKLFSLFPIIDKLTRWYFKTYLRFYEKIKHSRKFSKFFID